MRILVTGGLGFIGSNFIRMMLKEHPNYRITNLDKMTYAGNPENLRDVEKDSRYEFVKGDICDAKVVDRCVVGKDAIINFAAETHVDRSIIESGSFVRTDVLGTHTLLEAAKKHRTGRFLQVSTDEVYGSIEKGSFTEESPLRPNSPYSASKAGADMLVRSYNVTFGLPALITRSSNNYGPFQHPEKFMPLFITNLLEGKKVPLYGDGMNVRDWLFVMDNCRGIDTVFHSGKEGEVYNIGSDCEKPNREVVDMMLKVLGKGKDSIRFVEDRPGHDRRYSLDCARIAKLGWKPETGFEQGLKQTIEWYRENESWWKPLK